MERSAARVATPPGAGGELPSFDELLATNSFHARLAKARAAREEALSHGGADEFILDTSRKPWEREGADDAGVDRLNRILARSVNGEVHPPVDAPLVAKAPGVAPEMVPEVVPVTRPEAVVGPVTEAAVKAPAPAAAAVPQRRSVTPVMIAAGFVMGIGIGVAGVFMLPGTAPEVEAVAVPVSVPAPAPRPVAPPPAAPLVVAAAPADIRFLPDGAAPRLPAAGAAAPHQPRPELLALIAQDRLPGVLSRGAGPGVAVSAPDAVHISPDSFALPRIPEALAAAAPAPPLAAIAAVQTRAPDPFAAPAPAVRPDAAVDAAAPPAPAVDEAALPRVAVLRPVARAPSLEASLPGDADGPPLTQETALPPAPAAFAGRVKLHVPSGADPALVARANEAFATAGVSADAPVPVDFTISRSNVRFFHAEDAEAAAGLAGAIGAEARDFTSFKPLPPPGTIEVWLAGGDGGGGKAEARAALVKKVKKGTAKAPSTEFDQLRNRILQQLRNGDHL